MKYLKQVAVAAGVIVLGTTAVLAQRFDSAIISVNRVETVSASLNGSAWALTTDGKVLHCRFASERVACYDRNGLVERDY